MSSHIASAVPSQNRSQFFFFVSLLTIILGVLFARSFDPDLVAFSNDGPLGVEVAAMNHMPDTLMGCWQDSNSVGSNGGMVTLNFTSLIFWVMGPVGFAKSYAMIALWILGFCAWLFFRQLKLSPLAAILGALAAMLNSAFFGNACWGVASGEIALGMNFLALALIISNTAETPWQTRWTRLALAGLCVGVNVMEAADIGALYSVLVAIFLFYKSLTETEGGFLAKTLQGIGRVAIVAIFAGFLATQTVVSLVSTQIQDVAGTAQDSETKAQHWDWATQWSLPKLETLGLVVPGLFGYKMDTPKGMMPQFQKSFEGGVYWGGMGRSPEIDRFLDSGAQGQMPQGFMRFSSGGGYCGILVCLLAAWAIAQSLRIKDSPFSDRQKKFVWFWTVVMGLSLPIAWGRFSVFYSLLYQLPYFSTIRNPCKFLIFFNLSLIILFAYGFHIISRRYLDIVSAQPSGLATRLKNWWSKADNFDRKWTFACAGVFLGGVLGWLIFSAQKPGFVHYLQKMGFPDENMAGQIAAFSIGQAGWFLLLLAVAIVLLVLTIAGYFSGPRAKLGGFLLGAFLVIDLGRADLPYVIHWDYKQKYEIGSLNPIVDFLRDKPYEHRVAGLPFRAPEGMELFDQLYRIEWMQHHFLYYNIQCLDIVQMSRMPEDLKAYLEVLSPRGTVESAPLIARHWLLTNTRYLLGPAGYSEVMNQQLDPAQHRFRILQRFEVLPKPGILQPSRLEELTAVPNENGRYALFEFTGALPRVKLYANWQVNTNDQANLKTLADLNFDPAKTVLVSTPQKNLPASATNENPGTVEFASYAPKHLAFDAKVITPSVLLLNDKYDSHWRVTVDGQPAALLRCNYLMRGVYLTPGRHTVKFDFGMEDKLMLVTVSALTTGILLSALLVFFTRNPQPPASK